MTYMSSILLGAVQGVTEFLPVSSSGHLIIARELFGLSDEYGLAVDAVLQLGTILAVIAYFAKDILALLRTFARLLTGRAVDPVQRALFFGIIIGTLPAVVLGLLLEKQMESTFRSAGLVATTLIVGAALMLFAEWRAHVQHASTTLTAKRGFLIGLFQCLALVPGMSRSGSTISGGLILGLERETATRFSFLLALPVIAGSGLKKLLDLVRHHELGMLGPELAVGTIVAFVVGLLSIRFLLTFLRTHTLRAFAWYRIALGCGVLGWLAFYR